MRIHHHHTVHYYLASRRVSPRLYHFRVERSIQQTDEWCMRLFLFPLWRKHLFRDYPPSLSPSFQPGLPTAVYVFLLLPGNSLLPRHLRVLRRGCTFNFVYKSAGQRKICERTRSVWYFSPPHQAANITSKLLPQSDHCFVVARGWRRWKFGSFI